MRRVGRFVKGSVPESLLLLTKDGAFWRLQVWQGGGRYPRRYSTDDEGKFDQHEFIQAQVGKGRIIESVKGASSGGRSCDKRRYRLAAKTLRFECGLEPGRHFFKR